MQPTTIVEPRVTPTGGHLPLPTQKGQNRLYVQSGGHILVLEVKSVSEYPPELAQLGATLQRILFAAIPDPRLRARRPIPVEIAHIEGTFAASCPELEEFGYGRTRSDALDDLGKTLCDLYFSLADQQEQLGPHLKLIQSRLGQYLELRQRR